MQHLLKKVKISPTLPILLFSMLLFDRADIGKLAVIFLAAAIHEFGHFTAAKILKIPLKRISIDIFGAFIEVASAECSYVNEAILSFLGPLFNLISAAIAILLHGTLDIRLFTVASIFFALINLLPIRGFDGGRTLTCLLLMRFSPKCVSTIVSFTSFLCLVMLWSVSVYFIMRTTSYLSLFIFSSVLFARVFFAADV